MPVPGRGAAHKEEFDMTTKSPARARPEPRCTIRLTPEQQAYVVRRLATYGGPAAIMHDLKKLFGIEVKVKTVEHYHPERSTHEKLAERWKELFWETRKAYLAACAEIGTMEQMVRVRLREDMVLMARDGGHYRIANELLDSIAREAGKMFAKRATHLRGAADDPLRIR
jgi:hypothetical protein